MKTLIIGSGQLSYYLEKEFPSSQIAGLSVPIWHDTKHFNGKPKKKLVYLDIANRPDVEKFLSEFMPTIIINTAGITSIAESFRETPKCFEVNFMGPLYIMDWISTYHPTCKFIQCSSTEVYQPRDFSVNIDLLQGPNFIDYGGMSHCLVKDEKSTLGSVNPYGKSKIFSQNMVEFYRDIHKLNASCAVFANFESKLRDHRFVTAKIISHIKRLKKNPNLKPIGLGDLTSVRSWMHASEAAHAIKLISEREQSGDWVFAGSNISSIQYFLELAFKIAGVEDYQNHYYMDEGLKREFEPLWVKPSADLAREELGWETTYSLEDIIKDMLSSEWL